MPEITVAKAFQERKDYLMLTLLNSEEGLKKKIDSAEIHRPGLALGGFLERFPYRRTQVLGETEMAYISSLPKERLVEVLEGMFSFDMPWILISKGIAPPQELLAMADRKKTAVFSSRLSTSDLIGRLSVFLDNYFAPSITVHGTLVDVYGVGLLYTGKSGVGKSECALDLIERGHRLVADDVIKITRKSSSFIVGQSSELLGQHMEVRGIGIIDIEALFGIRAIRIQKRIEVEVRLQYWEETAHYERLGIEDKYTTILGVEIPLVTIPVSPGKNITVISEVIAMNHMLKVYGENSAQDLSRRLTERLARSGNIQDYIESDYE
ncbi:MAG: HPr(Ser) kinase/phosphatase [candidate division Zixibacteria bacterium]|nr:HPr(Ser) kinase/phosphatase [candidate division Zixibacteria bacterium]